MIIRISVLVHITQGIIHKQLTIILDSSDSPLCIIYICTFMVMYAYRYTCTYACILYLCIQALDCQMKMLSTN